MSERRPMIFELSRNMIIFAVVALLFGLFIVEDKLAYAFGIFIGLIVNIVKLFMMEDSIRKSLYRNPQSATNYIRFHYMFRFLVTGAVLYLGLITPYIHFIGLVIGLLALKPAAYMQGRLEPEVPKDGSVEFLEWEEEDEDEKSDFW